MQPSPSTAFANPLHRDPLRSFLHHLLNTQWTLALAATWALGCAPERYSDTLYPEGDIKEVIVLGDAGEVIVEPGTTLRVERQIRAPERSLNFSHYVDQGALVLENWCHGILPCSVDMHLQMSENMPVFIVLESGEVRIRDMNTVDVEVARGHVQLENVGDADIQVAQGNVQGSIHDGSDVSVTVAEGDVSLVLPGGKWSADIQSPQQDVSGLNHDDNARRNLSLIAQGGVIQARASSEIARR